jgi:hypothetical protein
LLFEDLEECFADEGAEGGGEGFGVDGGERHGGGEEIGEFGGAQGGIIEALLNFLEDGLLGGEEHAAQGGQIAGGGRGGCRGGHRGGSRRVWRRGKWGVGSALHGGLPVRSAGGRTAGGFGRSGLEAAGHVGEEACEGGAVHLCGAEFTYEFFEGGMELGFGLLVFFAKAIDVFEQLGAEFGGEAGVLLVGGGDAAFEGVARGGAFLGEVVQAGFEFFGEGAGGVFEAVGVAAVGGAEFIPEVLEGIDALLGFAGEAGGHGGELGAGKLLQGIELLAGFVAEGGEVAGDFFFELGEAGILLAEL